MTTASAESRIEGSCDPCYVADEIQVGIGAKVAQAAENERVMSTFVGAISAVMGEEPAAICFNSVPDTFAADAAEHIAKTGGCNFVRTGQCPLVGFLTKKALEDY